jgi:hypothetical protein
MREPEAQVTSWRCELSDNEEWFAEALADHNKRAMRLAAQRIKEAHKHLIALSAEVR